MTHVQGGKRRGGRRSSAASVTRYKKALGDLCAWALGGRWVVKEYSTTTVVLVNLVNKRSAHCQSPFLTIQLPKLCCIFRKGDCVGY